MAKFDIRTLVRYRGRLHVVAAVTPIGVHPSLIDLEDIESGRVRSVNMDDPGIDPVEPGEMPNEISDDDVPGF